MYEAVFNGQVIARSDATVVVEGNHYFPAEWVQDEFLIRSRMRSVCPWKGLASYYTVEVDGVRDTNAAWTYWYPSPLARRIKNHVAFWRDVRGPQRLSSLVLSTMIARPMHPRAEERNMAAGRRQSRGRARSNVVGRPLTRAELDADLSWWDVLGLAMLAGVGFTVSLLIGDLAFGAGNNHDDHVKFAVLAGTITAAALAGILLRVRSNGYQSLFAAETADHVERD